MSAHTPGPWEVDMERSRIYGAGDKRVILLNVAMSEADARLIAAAPDLLAALKAVVAIADRKTDEFDMARVAIAKAEGRA